jgi:lipopolysaccharide biosynthesis protein
VDLKDFFAKTLKHFSRAFSLLLLKLSASEKSSKLKEGQCLHFEKQSFEGKRKICFFSHYSNTSEINQSVLHYLQCLKDCGFYIAFCTTSKSHSDNTLENLKSICSLVIKRENLGLDFGSWASCHQFLKVSAPNYLNVCDGLLFANDSVLGPFFPLQPIFQRMDEERCDFWSLTENYFPTSHLQSYFLFFKPKTLKTAAFQQFLERIKLYHDKKKIIFEYELGLTKLLKTNKLLGSASFPYKKIQPLAPERIPSKQAPYGDPTIYFWDLLIQKMDFPFLKKSVISLNSQNVAQYNDPYKIVSKASQYPMDRFNELKKED